MSEEYNKELKEEVLKRLLLRTIKEDETNVRCGTTAGDVRVIELSIYSDECGGSDFDNLYNYIKELGREDI